MSNDPSSPIEQLREVLDDYGRECWAKDYTNVPMPLARISAIVVESIGPDDDCGHVAHVEPCNNITILSLNKLRASLRQQWSNQGEK